MELIIILLALWGLIQGIRIDKANKELSNLRNLHNNNLRLFSGFITKNELIKKYYEYVIDLIKKGGE